MSFWRRHRHRTRRRELDSFIEMLTQSIDPRFADWPMERQRQVAATLNELAEVLERASG